jgi:hypothetical protein
MAQVTTELCGGRARNAERRFGCDQAIAGTYALVPIRFRRLVAQDGFKYLT